MDPNPELETKIEAFLLKEMTATEKADFEKEMTADPVIAAEVAVRKEQARLLRRAFLREQIQRSKAEFGALDLPETQTGGGKTVSLFSQKWAMAAGLALALGGAAFWMWNQGKKVGSDLAQTREKTEALRDELARKEAEKALNEQKIIETLPVLSEKEKAADPILPKKDAPKIAQNEPKKGNDRNVGPAIYSNEQPNIRGNEANKKGKGNAIFESINAKIDLEKARASMPEMVKKMDQKRFDEVASMLKNADLEPAQENAGIYLAAVCHFQKGELKNAIGELDSLYFKSNPYFLEAKWLMALCRLREEKLEAAKQLFTEISLMKNHPNQAAAASALSKF